jgi:prepilin-type N-terminal cleavage/methylation domain-containing protein
MIDVREQPARRRGFSLLELAIVAVIIVIIGAIALPRISRGSRGAEDAALAQSTTGLNKALDHYWAEHDATYPTLADIVSQLTRYSDRTGTQFADQPDGTNGIIYGPYLREIPPVPSGPHKGNRQIGSAGQAVGWIYDPSVPEIRPNLEAASEHVSP